MFTREHDSKSDQLTLSGVFFMCCVHIGLLTYLLGGITVTCLSEMTVLNIISDDSAVNIVIRPLDAFCCAAVRLTVLPLFRTPVSARSYRASAFLLNLLLFCQANKFT